jgi:hypothetical protein
VDHLLLALHLVQAEHQPLQAHQVHLV